MSTGQKLTPMNRLLFNGMAWSFRLRDLLKPPRQVLQPADIQPGLTVVDYGCGPGSYTIEAAKMVGPEGRVYGVDIHPLAVESVRRKAARLGLNQVAGVLVDGFDTGLPAGCADRVLLMDMIHMVPDRPALLREVRRLLQPDGRAFVQVHHMSPEPIIAALDASGFTVADRGGGNLLARPAAP